MIEQTIALFYQYREVAYLLSILINILISILAFVPSVFLTAANIIVFGFWPGTLLSFLGEAVGAMVSFWLYRKGGRRLVSTKLEKYPKVRKLLSVEGKEAFLLILSLRLVPFVPSGLVTLAAALGKVSLLVFIFSSTIGKMPALLMEAYSVNEVTRWTTEGKVLIGAVGIGLLVTILYKLKK